MPKEGAYPGNRLEQLYAIPSALPRDLISWWNFNRAHLLYLLETRHWRSKTNRMNIAHSKEYCKRVGAEGQVYHERKVFEPQ